jgi:hypothetical protein
MITQYGFIFNKTKGDKYMIKKEINNAVDDKNPKLLSNLLKKLKSNLKQIDWSVNEYIQAFFPKMYIYLMDRMIKSNLGQKLQTEFIDVLIKYDIKLTNKQLDKLKEKLDKDNYKILKNMIKKTSIKMIIPSYGKRTIKQGDSVVIYLRDLNGTLYLDANNNYIQTVAIVTKIISQKKVEVKDSFNQLLYLNTTEISPALIDIYGHQYYHNMAINAHKLITSPPGISGITLSIGNSPYIRNVGVGDHVLINLRKQNGTLIVHNGNYVPVLAKINAIYDDYNISIIDSIGNIHHGFSKYDMLPVLFDIHGQQYYADIVQKALRIYAIY